ncbi:hypothetical protein LUW74_20010 [Actinomadura madurae]|uniref:hypothetical protein n=1 Tax=Actinomadura madurae TaxID=1993 RepID=UPI002025C492|nr:hypothetical protein [Actinomadura madurae]URN05374.1 hypothetical protein LUW74_20010 [Actinomadura madurae]
MAYLTARMGRLGFQWPWPTTSSGSTTVLALACSRRPISRRHLAEKYGIDRHKAQQIITNVEQLVQT